MENKIIVSRVNLKENWQELLRLENKYLQAIGEQTLTEENQEQLFHAIQDERITFFLAKCGEQVVGICSVVKHFSTFACTNTGTFEDFYVEPMFRKHGIARMLVQTAQHWCREQGLASLTVCCAPCDEQMYEALGFDTPLGKTYATII